MTPFLVVVVLAVTLGIASPMMRRTHRDRRATGNYHRALDTLGQISQQQAGTTPAGDPAPTDGSGPRSASEAQEPPAPEPGRTGKPRTAGGTAHVVLPRRESGLARREDGSLGSEDGLNDVVLPPNRGTTFPGGEGIRILRSSPDGAFPRAVVAPATPVAKVPPSTPAADPEGSVPSAAEATMITIPSKPARLRFDELGGGRDRQAHQEEGSDRAGQPVPVEGLSGPGDLPALSSALSSPPSDAAPSDAGSSDARRKTLVFGSPDETSAAPRGASKDHEAAPAGARSWSPAHLRLNGRPHLSLGALPRPSLGDLPRLSPGGRLRSSLGGLNGRRRIVAAAAAVAVVLVVGAIVATTQLGSSGTHGPARRAASGLSVRHRATAPVKPPPTVPTTTSTLPPAPFTLVSTGSGISVYQLAGTASITLHAAGPCWVDIHQTDSNGPELFTATMAPGQTETVSGPVWIRLGAPAAITVDVNGSSLPPLVSDGNPYDLELQ
jgi:hypothetical protein